MLPGITFDGVDDPSWAIRRTAEAAVVHRCFESGQRQAEVHLMSVRSPSSDECKVPLLGGDTRTPLFYSRKLLSLEVGNDDAITWKISS